MVKKRTIPQLPIRPLSGDCTFIVLDDTTVNAIQRLWAVTLYPNTWYDETTGLTIPETVDSASKTVLRGRVDAILDDFERGITMGCDIASILTTGFNMLDSRLSAMQSSILQSACCDNMTGNVIDPTSPLPEVVIPDDELCRKVRYAQWLATTFFERYFTPILTLGTVGIGTLIIATLTSVALPPYSTTLAEIALLAVELVAVIGGETLSIQIIDVLPDVFTAIYCRLLNGGADNAWDWLLDVIVDIVGSEPIATLIRWIIGASGALSELFDVNLSSMPAGFVADGCDCGIMSNWRMVNGNGTEFLPSSSGANFAEFSGLSYSQYMPGEQDNGYQYYYIKNVGEIVTGSVTVTYYPGTLSEGINTYGLADFTNVITANGGIAVTDDGVNSMQCRSTRYESPGILRIEWGDNGV